MDAALARATRFCMWRALFVFCKARFAIAVDWRRRRAAGAGVARMGVRAFAKK